MRLLRGQTCGSPLRNRAFGPSGEKTMFNIKTTIVASLITLILVLLYRISNSLDPTIATVAAILWATNAFGIVVNTLLLAYKPFGAVRIAINYINLVVLSTYLDVNGWTYA